MRQAIANSQDHVPVGHDFRPAHDRAVARHDLGIRSGQANHDTEAVQQPIERTAVRAVNIWILNRPIEIARHDDVQSGEINHRVAVGVGPRNRNQFHDLAIDVQFYDAFVGHKWQRRGRSGSARCAVCGRQGMHQPVAQFLAGKDDCSRLAEILVATGVIAMHMCVHHETDRLIGNLLDGRHNLPAQGRKLIVDHENAVRAHQHARRASQAFQRVEVGAEFCSLDLDLAEIRPRLSLCARSGRSKRKCNQCCCRKHNLRDVHLKPSSGGRLVV